MGSTEWLPGDDIALMAAVLEERFLKKSAHPVATTMSTRVLPYTQSTMPSFRQALGPAEELPSTSQTNHVSSAPTSSNTQRLEESLSKDDKPTDPHPMPIREPRPKGSK